MKPTLYRLLAASLAIPLALSPALAQETEGDAETGETLFARNCISCHVIADEEGKVLAGRRARTGPNLYEVMGNVPASSDDFSYSSALMAYGETGTLWEAENMTAYLQDPTGHLRVALDDPGASGRMAYRLRSEDDARDVAAFLARFSADEAEGAGQNPTDETDG